MAAVGEQARQAVRALAASQGLMRLALVRGLLRSRLYPTAFQVVGVGFLGLVLYFSFFGTLRAGQNFATTVTWVLWWGLLPWSFVLAARAWCGVCPVGALTEWVQRLGHLRRRLPGAFLKRYGVWLMAFTFLLLTWADRIWNVVGSPRATGILLAAILAGALVVGLLYQRRVWCRYLCPIGAFSGLYSMASFLELRASTGACADCKGKECYTGNPKAEGCPLYQFPAFMDSNRNCNLCANCLKTCPREATDLYLRPPGREMWGLRQPISGEAFLSLLLVAVVYVQTIDMTMAFPAYMKWLMEDTPIASYNLGISVTFIAAVTLVLGVYGGVSWLSSRLAGGGYSFGFTRFGYAYIFLALVGHLAHNLYHLLQEGPMALQAALENLGLRLSLPQLALSPALMTLVSVGMILLGLGGGLYILGRVGQAQSSKGWRVALPHMAFMLALGALYVQMFLLPMNPRHAH